MKTSSKPSENNYSNSLEHTLNQLANRAIEANKVTKSFVAKNDYSSTLSESLKQVENIFQHFHLVAKELQQRYNSRTPFEMNDEYDVQDLLEGLLRLHFDDVRREEPTPSYAGSSTKIDFLLAQEQIGIEAKRSRRKLDAKEIGKQLIIDIEHYKEHPTCKVLYFFVYDPEEYIVNPSQIENDLSKKRGNMSVKVLIMPKR